MKSRILIADYANPKHRQDIPLLLDAYAKDPMGGGKPLDPQVKQQLVDQLAGIPGAFSVLAYRDDRPVGLVNCFQGFSTFQGKPLINIHDVVVLEEFRGMGLSQRMLARVEEVARARRCCKLTLEVLSNNEAAKAAYRRCGFSDYRLDPAAGNALFWQKPLKDD